MPQAKSGGSKSTSGRKATSAGGAGKRSAASSAGAAKRAPSGAAKRATSAARSTRSSGGRAAASKPASGARSARAKASKTSPDAALEAAAQRLRKLNERIIEAGKEAGETTLANYEKALKAIASTIERGPGSSDIDWISNLATTQAKFIRDVTASWTASARDMLK